MNVGIVGCGFISGIHVNAWKDAGQTVAAVCDLSEKTALQFSKDWNIPSHYTNFSEMLKKEDLFAISVCVPPKFHAKVAIEALEAGCNVVVEKPFTENTEDAKKLLNVLKKTKINPSDIMGISVTNQRETIVPVEKAGNPLRRALVWQDRRTIPECEQIKEKIGNDKIYEIKGLTIDPYFSASKILFIKNRLNRVNLCIE